MSGQQLDLREGTVSFWIEKNKVKYGDGEVVILLNLKNDQGSIFLVKDSENKLRFFHIIEGKGKTEALHDVSSLSSDKAHMFAVTWSLTSKNINLYIDGEVVSNQPIKY